MHEPSNKRVVDFLERFERSLRIASDRRRAAVEEVRADLVAHIEHHAAKGCEQAEAVDRALEEMGDPDTLAHQIVAAAPAFNHPALRVTRYILTVLVAGGFAWLAFELRAWRYGTSVAGLLATGSVFLTLVLLLWPGVVWRRNWLFSFVPAVVILLLAMAMMSVGTEQATTLGEAQSPAPDRSVIPYVLLAALSALVVYLLVMIQRPKQRLIAAALGLLLPVAIELPYKIEESRYEQAVDQAATVLEDYRAEHQSYPEADIDAVTQVESLGFHYWANEQRDGYSLLWDRPLSPEFALGIDHQANRWIND